MCSSPISRLGSRKHGETLMHGARDSVSWRIGECGLCADKRGSPIR
jgi:hypothetical protein